MLFQVAAKKPEEMAQSDPQVWGRRPAPHHGTKRHQPHLMTMCHAGLSLADELLGQAVGTVRRAATESHQGGCQHPGISGRTIQFSSTLLDLPDQHVPLVTWTLEGRVRRKRPRPAIPDHRSAGAGKADGENVQVGRGGEAAATDPREHRLLGHREVSVDPQIGLNQPDRAIHLASLPATGFW
jgi:hypothetical protein